MGSSRNRRARRFPIWFSRSSMPKKHDVVLSIPDIGRCSCVVLVHLSRTSSISNNGSLELYWTNAAQPINIYLSDLSVWLSIYHNTHTHTQHDTTEHINLSLVLSWYVYMCLWLYTFSFTSLQVYCCHRGGIARLDMSMLQCPRLLSFSQKDRPLHSRSHPSRALFERVLLTPSPPPPCPYATMFIFLPCTAIAGKFTGLKTDKARRVVLMVTAGLPMTIKTTCKFSISMSNEYCNPNPNSKYYKFFNFKLKVMHVYINFTSILFHFKNLYIERIYLTPYKNKIVINDLT